MKALKNFLWSMLAEKGEISSKRCIAISGMVTLIWLAAHGHLTGKAVDPTVYQGIEMVTMAAAAISAGEKFALNKPAPPPPPPAPDENQALTEEVAS